MAAIQLTKNSAELDNCPEFHGYNTKLSKEEGHLPQPKMKVFYLPLIDMKPSDPDTMLTAMMRVKELTAQTGQAFSVLTCDQQLYRVAMQISWDQPKTQRYVPLFWWNARSDELCGCYWVIDD